MIAASGLQKSYDGRLVLDIPALRIASGERVALLGPNGSGKTTLLRLLAGTETADAGSIKLESPACYMPQTPYAFDCSVQKNVLLALPKMDGAEARAKRALSLVGMQDFAGARGNRLSGGERQRMALARVLAGDHRLLLLDEPTSSTDVAAADAIEKALLAYAAAQEATLLFSTHAPAQARRLATRVLVLSQGRVVEDGAPDEVMDHPASAEAAAFLRHWRF